MPAHQIHVTGASAAPPSAVFALIADVDTWSQWGTWVSSGLESPDPQGGGGVGAVRRLTSKTLGSTVVSRERVLELVPDRRLVYTLLSGLPLEGYVGRVELEPDGQGGTRLVWASSFDARYPGTGWFYVLILRWFIGETLRAVARAAEAGRVAA